MKLPLVTVCFLHQLVVVVENTPVKMLILKEASDEAAEWFRDSLPLAEADNKDLTLSETTVSVARGNQGEAVQQVCQALYKGVNLVVDMTWTGWGKSRDLSEEAGVPYIRIDVLLTPFIKAADDTLHYIRNATDSVLIFENRERMEQSLYFLIKHSVLRILVLDGLNKTSAASLLSMRPSPNFYVIIANTQSINNIYKVAREMKISDRDDRWHLVFTDFRYAKFNRGLLTGSVATITLKEAYCCYLLRVDYPCDCPEDTEVVESFVKLTAFFLANVFLNIDQNNQLKLVTYDCSGSNDTDDTKEARKYFYEEVSRLAHIQNGIDYSVTSTRLRMESEHVISDPTKNVNIATWYRDRGLVIESGYVISPVKRFFRVGTAESIPWSYRSIDPETGLVRLDKNGNEIWKGYCIDFLNKLAEDMNFDYELVINEHFGSRSKDGTWKGLVGDLATGQTDIVIAALIMTSEREEVIDFVAPYFEQTGISIVIRKPVRKTSLFKFMTVLRLEVWISIVVALMVTGIMIWLLDKYSPYSARNNKRLYPYPCRVFTLKESFWFALTSFTPQGGGEAPKALSGRTLVAAYWLFVVLMLATFTANLAAFLTVERMQSPVQSLEQLSRQSRINYTVVENSDTHRYFQNMKNAEDILYTAWKQITLNSSSFETQFRVWDYPIREQYGHILQAIEKTGLVPNASVGYQKVMDSEQGEFALIHDASQIRYEVNRNCNLTEVGELFAEKPYSVAVQQGSQLNEEISRRILDLQKDRYFETLLEKYWNTPAKSSCHITDDNEGITLESLGGVFIATLFGLGLAMVTLSIEIFYHKNKKKPSTKTNITNKRDNLLFSQAKIYTELLTKKEFGVENTMMKSRLVRPKISFINVAPREFY